MQVRALLQAKDACGIDACLVQVLQKVCSHEQWQEISVYSL